MKSMVVAKLKALISSEVNKQLAENYQELLSKLVKIDVEHMEEDMSYAIGAAYFMIGGRLIFTPIIYRDGGVDSISYIGDVENDKLYGLTRKMYKKMTSVIANDFGEVMSKKNEERASVDSGIVGHLFATPRTYSPKTAGEGNDAIIISAMDNSGFRARFKELMSSEDYSDVMGGVYGDHVTDRARDLDSFSKVASEVPIVASKRRYETIASLRSLPMEKRASAAIAIAEDGFFQDGVVLNKVAAVSMPKFGEQLIAAKGNTVIANTPGSYKFIKKDYSLIDGFIARVAFSENLMLVIEDGVRYIKNGFHSGQWEEGDAGAAGFLAIEGSSFISPSKTVSTVLNKYHAKAKNKDKSELAVYGHKGTKHRSIIISPNTEEIYIFSIDSNPIAVGDKEVYLSASYDAQDIEIIIDPNCRRFMRQEGRVLCSPSMVSKSTHSIYGRFEGDVKASLMSTADIGNSIVKTAEFSVGYKAGAYSVDGEAMKRESFNEVLQAKGFNNRAIGRITKVAEASQGSEVPMQEMSQTLKAILAEITENKHTMSQVLQLMGEARGQAAKDGVPQEDDPATLQAIQEMATMLGASGEEMIAQAKEQGIPLKEIASELEAVVQQKGGQQNPNAQPQPQPQQEGMPVPGGQQQDPNGQQANAQGIPGLQGEGFNQNMTPEMIQQLKEISDKDMFNAAIISYFVDANNANDIIGRYIEEIDGGVVAMAKVMLFIETQKGKMTETIGEKQISVFINRGKNILNRMTDFVIDATLIQ